MGVVELGHIHADGKLILPYPLVMSIIASCIELKFEVAITVAADGVNVNLSDTLRSIVAVSGDPAAPADTIGTR